MKKPKKIPVDELLRLACIHAETDREDFVRSYDCITDPKDRDAATEAKEYLRQLRAYRRKRWGRTKMESLLAGAKEVSVADIARGPNRTFGTDAAGGG